MRGFLLLYLSGAWAGSLFGQQGTHDPFFDRVPFDQWLGEGNQAHLHWEAIVGRAELSFHQRLISQVEITLDGRDLVSRRGKGELVFLVQITDAKGARYQQHGTVDLTRLDENVKAIDLHYAQREFVLPGDYQLAVVILDTETNEHAASQSQFRVIAPRDSLKDAWQDLPPIEFVVAEESPESWYLPSIQGRLKWATAVRSPIRLNVILNISPGSRRTPSSGLAGLLPTLKVISQAESSSLDEHIEVLDLARQRAVFEQNQAHDLVWPKLKASLADANTASIDIHSLSEQREEAQFFVSEVRKVLRSSAEKPCALVVLTKAVSLDSGEDREPISLESLPDCRVFYIRYRARVQGTPALAQGRTGGRGRGGRMGGPMGGGNRNPQEGDDQLESTLKPLKPKVFDVETAEEMSRALSEIEKGLLKSQ